MLCARNVQKKVVFVSLRETAKKSNLWRSGQVFNANVRDDKFAIDHQQAFAYTLSIGIRNEWPWMTLKAIINSVSKYTVSQKKQDTKLLSITSPNKLTDPFSKFFHCYTQQEICNKVVIKDPPTPSTLRYTTLWYLYGYFIESKNVASSIKPGPLFGLSSPPLPAAAVLVNCDKQNSWNW